MPNEFIARNGIISKGNVVVTGSVTATGGIITSGSLIHTGSVNISGSLIVTGSITSTDYIQPQYIAASASVVVMKPIGGSKYVVDMSTGGAGDLRFFYGGGSGWSYNWYTNDTKRVTISDSGLTVTGSAIVRGTGTTSATTSFLVQNSAGTAALTVKDDSTVTIGSGYAKTINLSPEYGGTRSRISGGYGNGYLEFGGAGYGNVSKLADNEAVVASDAYPQSLSIGPAGTSQNIGAFNYSIKSGSATHFFVSSSGNVGVGTTSPSASFTVGNTDTVFGSNVGYGTIYGAANDGIVQIKTNGTSTEMWFRPNNSPGSYNSSYWSKIVQGNYSFGIYSGNYQSLVLATGNAPGNGATMTLTGATGAGVDAVTIVGPTNAGRIALTTYGSSPITLNGGNVLVGTTTGSAKLTVKGTGATNSTTALLVQNSNASASLSVLDDGNSTFGGNILITANSLSIRDAAYGSSNINLRNPTGIFFEGNVGQSVGSIKLNQIAYEQYGVAINSTGTTNPPASAVLALNSSFAGFLLTRHSSTSAISSPAQGLQTYITASATEGIYYYNSGSYQGWTRVLNDSGSQSISGSLNVTSFTASNATITGNVTVLGTASINTLIVNQIAYSSGSNQLGDAANDCQTLYGTVRIPTGSLTVSGSMFMTGSAVRFISDCSVLGGKGNTVTGLGSVVVGGENNSITGQYSVAGGYQSTVSGNYAGIFTGFANSIPSYKYSVIVGGTNNTSCGGGILHGQLNTVSAYWSGIAAGCCNTVSQILSFVGAGRANSVSGTCSAVVSGCTNTVSNNNSIIGAGTSNTVTGLNSGIFAGSSNLVGCAGGAILYGSNNKICNQASYGGSVIVGGAENCTLSNSYFSFVGAGKTNTSSGFYNALVAGRGNTLSSNGAYGILGAGQNNYHSSCQGALIAGANNILTGNNNFIGAGTLNTGSGCFSFTGAGQCNRNLSQYGAIGSGIQNYSTGLAAVVAGGVAHNLRGNSWDPATCNYGTCNLCNNGDYSFIGGGISNWAGGCIGTIAGGNINAICLPSTGSFIGGGGNNNICAGNCNVIAGGQGNSIVAGNVNGIIAGTSNVNNGSAGILGGGQQNTISGGGSFNFLGAGYQNTISSRYGFLGSGQANTLSGACSALAGGRANTVSGDFAFVGAGCSNTVSGVMSAVVAGSGSSATGCESFVGGGRGNTASGIQSFVGSGLSNSATAAWAVTVGGAYNVASGINTFLGSGLANTVSGNYSTLVGGQSNTVSGLRSAMGGGLANSATAQYTTVAGGCGNTASGNYSGILGGGGNIVTATRSFIVGSNLTASMACYTYMNNAVITGSTSIGTTTTGSALNVYKSGSTVVDIQGSQGQLFSVIDSLTGSLMSVNDISGLPILEVFSNDTVVMGTYGAPGLTVSGSTVAISASLLSTVQTGSLPTGSNLIYTVNTASYTAGFFDYYVISGSNYRAGNIMSVWGSGSIKYTDLATPDIGSTVNLQFSMSLSASSAQLFASASSAGWTVKTLFRTI